MRLSTLPLICIVVIASMTWYVSRQSSEWQFIDSVIRYHSSLYERAPLYFPTITSAQRTSSSLIPQDLINLAPAKHTSLTAQSIAFSDGTSGYLLSGVFPRQEVGISSLQYGTHIAGLGWKTDLNSYDTGIAIRDFQNETRQVRAFISAYRFVILIEEKRAKY